MEGILIYISIIVHSLLIILLWFKVYKGMQKNKARLNKSIWIVGFIALLYVIIMGSATTVINTSWYDSIFFAPCYLISFFLIYGLLANLIYSIILFLKIKKSV